MQKVDKMSLKELRASVRDGLKDNTCRSIKVIRYRYVPKIDQYYIEEIFEWEVDEMFPSRKFIYGGQVDKALQTVQGEYVDLFRL